MKAKPIRKTPPEPNALPKPASRRPRLLWLIGVILVVGVAAGAVWLFFAKSDPIEQTTYTVRRGDLKITVTEGGSLKAFRSVMIRSQVNGQARIIKLIPEGTTITEEDVKNGRILVALDSSDLREKATQQEINYQSAKAAYTQAKEAYDIQINQNESNIKGGQLKLKFSRMDLDRYLGAELVPKALAEQVDFIGLAKDPALRGAARQERRKLQSEIKLAGEEVERAEDQLEWTRKLSARGYVRQNELKADSLAFSRKRVQLEQTQTALELFLRYEFPKEAEQLLSDCNEARKELQRIRARARSEIAKAEAEKRAKEAQHNLQEDRLKKLKRQIEHCTIPATQPGLVVHGSGRFRWHRSGQTIEEGAMVRRRQVILRLPDPSTMVADITVHESAIDQVKVGQSAKIKVDAFPDKQLTGKVSKVGIMPDSQNRWLNPDLKVYATQVSIHGTHPRLKPGMNVRVTILAGEVKDMLRAPVQAVFVREGIRVCYVRTDDGIRIQHVGTGRSSKEFVQIASGLNEGDRILLQEPADLPEAVKEEFSEVATRIKQEKERKAAQERADREAADRTKTAAGAKRPHKEKTTGPLVSAGTVPKDRKNVSREERRAGRKRRRAQKAKLPAR